VGILDDKYQKPFTKDNIYYGHTQTVNKLYSEYKDLQFVLAVGNNQTRKTIVEKLNISPDEYLTCIHPSAIVSPSAKIGRGTVVMASAVINAKAEVGHHCIINTASIVEHENVLEDFVHVSPKATLTGSVRVNEGAHIGAGSIIIPNITIGEWSVIGAGAVVIKDVPEFALSTGVPSSIKKLYREVRPLGHH
jgi:acetyltransferase EpsM